MSGDPDDRQPGRLRAWLGGVFPSAPEQDLRWWHVPVAIAVAAAGVGLLLGQERGMPPLDSIWGEDSRIFLGQALELTPWAAISKPYNGYIHLYPRLLAEVASQMPVAWVVPFFTLVSAVTVAGIALLTAGASAAHLRSRPVRWALAAALLVHPTAVSESYHTISHLHFFLAYAALWVLLWRPRGAAAGVLGVVVLAMAALSGPVPLLLVPLAVVRLLAVRGMRDRVFPVAFLLAGAVQFVALMAFLPAKDRPPPSVGFLLEVYGQRVLAPGVASQPVVAALWPELGWWLPASVTALVLLFAVWGWRGATRFRPLVVGLAGLSLVSFGVMAGLRTTGLAMIFGSSATFRADRFTIIPILALFAAAALLLSQRLETAGAATRHAAQAGLLAVLALFAVANVFPSHAPAGETWSGEIARAQQVCVSQAPSEVRLRPAGGAGAARRWPVDVPCARLLPGPDRAEEARPTPASGVPLPDRAPGPTSVSPGG